MLKLEFGKDTTFCWICGKDVPVGRCKTDEYGLAVHESCDARRIMLKGASQQAESGRTSPLDKAT